MKSPLGFVNDNQDMSARIISSFVMENSRIQRELMGMHKRLLTVVTNNFILKD